MKTLLKFRVFLFAFAALLFFSCGANRYANTGTSSDRTGTNGATNGSGTPPNGNAHQQTNRP